MIKNKSIFYANDKALNDALTQKKIKNSDLSDLFISRGIILSKETDRDDAAKYFCRLNHDYFDHQKISRILGVTKRRDKNNYTKIKGTFDEDKIQEILDDIKNEIEQYGDIAEAKKIGSVFQFRIKYQSTDYGKSEFKQVSENEAVLSIELDNSGFSLRSPFSAYAKDIKEKILDRAEGLTGANIEIEEIRLNEGLSNLKKSEFFNLLANGIKGHKVEDVTDIYVYNPKDQDANKDDDDINLGVHIKKANLKGKGVLNSDIVQKFQSEGFYISKIVWKVEPASKEALYELEAEFSSPQTCSDFSYCVRGVYNEAGYGEYNKTKNQLLKSEEVKYQRYIEESAIAAIKKLAP